MMNDDYVGVYLTVMTILMTQDEGVRWLIRNCFVAQIVLLALLRE